MAEMKEGREGNLRKVWAQGKTRNRTFHMLASIDAFRHIHAVPSNFLLFSCGYA